MPDPRRKTRARVAAIHDSARLGDPWLSSNHRAVAEPARATATTPAPFHGAAETKVGIEIRGVSRSHPPTASTAAITATRIMAWIQSRVRAREAAVVTDAATKRANSG